MAFDLASSVPVTAAPRSKSPVKRKFDLASAVPVEQPNSAAAEPANVAANPAPRMPTLDILKAAFQQTKKIIPIPPAATMLMNPGSMYPSGKENIVSLAKALRHPVDNIIKPIAQVGAGAVSKIMPGEAQGGDIQAEAAFDAMRQMYGERYGSIEKFNNTIAQDPVGFAADLSAATGITGGAASLVGKAGEVSKIGTIARVGKEVSAAGKTAMDAGVAIDPLVNAVKGVGAAAKFTGQGAKQLGAIAASLQTGKPKDAFLQAIDNPTPEFFTYLRDKAPSKAIVDSARDTLNSIGERESMAYRKTLGKIKEGSDIASELDITPIRSKLEERLLDFGVERTGKKMVIKTPEGPIKLKNGLDFSGSSLQLDAKAQADVAKVVAKIESIGDKAGDATPIQLDMTKKALQRLYSENSDSRAFVASVKGSVRELLGDKVPGYNEMTKRYENWVGFQDEFEKALLSKDSAAADTAFNKLSSVLKNNADLKKEVFAEFKNRGGKDFRPALAGQSLSEGTPNYLRTTLAAGAGAHFHVLANPMFWPVLALTSPRVAGEFFGAIGLGKKQVQGLVSALEKSKAGDATLKAIPKLAPSAARGAFQGSRAGDVLRMPQIQQEDEE